MQYHLDGFHPGDPAISAAQEDHSVGDIVDVLVVGCGPAGLTLATQLAQFPDINTKIIDRKSGPLEVGQADGIACRSMEMFEAFGFADKVAKEAYWVNEVSFWRPDAGGSNLTRADRIQDVEDGLSEMPHTILSQARVHDFYLQTMACAPTRLKPDYGVELVTLARTHAGYVSATLQKEGQEHSIKARFVVGCDGARSAVRKALGLKLKGQSARQLWGVMDVLAITGFPDIRVKCAIQSADQGSLLIIPREGGYMVRMYIELDAVQGDVRARDRGVTREALIAKAQAILAPYSLDVKQVPWWSAYDIGQRVCDTFDDATKAQEPRVFIAGDACHTHSPKAGQGMNVSMADTFNLGWKLASVLRGQAVPEMLQTYSQERRAKAKELIDFDRDMARLFTASPTSPKEAEQFQRYFKKHGRYTAGVETCYDPSLITTAATHQALVTGFPVGMRFHSQRVVRLADAKPLHLGHVMRADGRWRVILFAARDDVGQAGGGVAQMCDALNAGAVQRTTLPGAAIDSVIDVRAVFQAGHRALNIEQMPPLLLPQKGVFGLKDYEKVFCPTTPDIFDTRGIDRGVGAAVIVRPDQFVASILPMDDGDAVNAYFARFMVPVADRNG